MECTSNLHRRRSTPPLVSSVPAIHGIDGLSPRDSSALFCSPCRRSTCHGDPDPTPTCLPNPPLAHSTSGPCDSRLWPSPWLVARGSWLVARGSWLVPLRICYRVTSAPRCQRRDGRRSRWRGGDLVAEEVFWFHGLCMDETHCVRDSGHGRAQFARGLGGTGAIRSSSLSDPPRPLNRPEMRRWAVCTVQAVSEREWIRLKHEMRHHGSARQHSDGRILGH
jgi:hypothetical protein